MRSISWARAGVANTRPLLCGTVRYSSFLLAMIYPRAPAVGNGPNPDTRAAREGCVHCSLLTLIENDARCPLAGCRSGAYKRRENPACTQGACVEEEMIAIL